MKDFLLENNLVKEENLTLLENPKHQEVMDAFRAMSKRVQESPEKDYTLIVFFAGHGVTTENKQSYLVNEFSEQRNYYKYIQIEAMLRGSPWK